MTTRLGLCPACQGQTVTYSRDRIEVLECSCGWFITSKSPDYNRVHNQAFTPLTEDERNDRKAAQVERVIGNLFPGALPVGVGRERP